jgi:O-methyltransferase
MTEPHHEEAARRYIALMKKVLTASIYDESAWRALRSGTPGLAVPRLLRPAALLLRDTLVRILNLNSLLLVKRRQIPAAEREAGTAWPLFGYTMVGERRLDNIQFCVEQVLKDGVPGDFIETGVWRGGASIFMRSLLSVHGVTDRLVWLADSFQGLPAPDSDADGWDMSGVDYLKVSLDEVKANFARFGLLDAQVRFLPGWFSDTLPTAPIEQLAILRLDGDLYSSTMDALRSLYHKVSKGGYVIVDDYHVWPGCKQAVTEFLASKELAPEILPIDVAGAFWRV